MDGLHLRVALYMAVSLLIGMDVREYVRAAVISSLGDPTPRLWGRRTLNPKAWFDPFGSGVLPALILVLWAAGASFLPPPVAYGKPAPVETAYLKHPVGDQVRIGLAGPLANVALGVAAGLLVRVVGATTNFELFLALTVFEFTQLCLAIFHLLPIPGLDGARLVGLALRGDAARVYRDADKYLPLFVLVVLFVLAGPIQSIVYSLVSTICTAVSGFGCQLAGGG
jgi:Zn-dependent protease